MSLGKTGQFNDNIFYKCCFGMHSLKIKSIESDLIFAI